MATTFKAIIYRDNKKDDGTYNVKIRVTHNRQNTKVSTKIYVTPEDIYKTSLKLKNQKYIDITDDLIKSWRNYIAELGVIADTMTLKEIVDYLKKREEKENTKDSFSLDFIAYGRQIAAKKSEGTARNYCCSLNALERFMNGKTLDVNDITVKFLESFEEFIKNEPVLTYSPKTKSLFKSNKSKAGGRAISAYMACLRHIHNEARKEFNDEDLEQINIRRSPFSKYTVKQPSISEPRAIDIKTIQKIIDLPDFIRTDGSVIDLTRRDLARDCFILSFAFAGMNAADLYDCPVQDFGKRTKIIFYQRKKTRTRRRDKAKMFIRVEPFIWPLLKKYKDPTGERLFCFYKHYSTSNAFNVALRNGLLQIQKAIKSKQKFTFYSARHSWATISCSNEVKLDKYIVHEGLVHVDEDMKVTDLYVKKDYSRIWDANSKILNKFNWTSLKERAKKY